MKFFILSGSHRAEAQTLKVAKYTASVLARDHPGADVHLYSLSGNPLPLWDETTAGEIGHKPGLIVTVSASRGGSYPVAELRMSGTKNNRLCWIPEHVIIHHAEQNLNAPDGSADLGKEDALQRKRLRYALRLLEEYGKALKQVRGSGAVDHKTFPSGM
jgi:hypothetical protein